MGFAGCPHDCPKSATNDVGFQGAVLPELSKELCIGCGLCVKSCSDNAIEMGTDHRPVFATERCTWCGDCVKVCPTEAWKGTRRGYTVRFLLDDGEPVKNVPRSLKAEGHKLLSLQEADGYYLLTLEKGTD